MIGGLRDERSISTKKVCLKNVRKDRFSFKKEHVSNQCKPYLCLIIVVLVIILVFEILRRPLHRRIEEVVKL